MARRMSDVETGVRRAATSRPPRVWGAVTEEAAVIPGMFPIQSNARTVGAALRIAGYRGHHLVVGLLERVESLLERVERAARRDEVGHGADDGRVAPFESANGELPLGDGWGPGGGGRVQQRAAFGNEPIRAGERDDPEATELRVPLPDLSRGGDLDGALVLRRTNRLAVVSDERVPARRVQRPVGADGERPGARVALAAGGAYRQVALVGQYDIECIAGRAEHASGRVQADARVRHRAGAGTAGGRCERFAEHGSNALVPVGRRVREVGRGRVERFGLRDRPAEGHIDSITH